MAVFRSPSDPTAYAAVDAAHRAAAVMQRPMQAVGVYRLNYTLPDVLFTSTAGFVFLMIWDYADVVAAVTRARITYVQTGSATGLASATMTLMTGRLSVSGGVVLTQSFSKRASFPARRAVFRNTQGGMNAFASVSSGGSTVVAHGYENITATQRALSLTADTQGADMPIVMYGMSALCFGGSGISSPQFRATVEIEWVELETRVIP